MLLLLFVSVMMAMMKRLFVVVFCVVVAVISNVYINPLLIKKKQLSSVKQNPRKI